MAIGHGKVRRGVVMRPVCLAKFLAGVEPRVFTAIRRKVSRARAFVKIMICGLPSVTTASAVDHDPHRAVVLVDLHLDEVVASADAAKLGPHLVVGLRD